ncbi:MAG: DNA polymerase III subunit delta [Chitinophagaceae bacterium]
MSLETIISSWEKKIYKQVYWIDGDEEYFINKIINYAEHNILPEGEASFNLTVFYGRDANWPDVVNACCRYPMFADKQVVLLKEAQLMKDIDKLVNYISQPLASTIFVIAFKEKKVDGRTALGRLLKEKKGIEVLTTKKLPDYQLSEWASNLVKAKGYGITTKALALVVEHIGNDLNRIENEIEKLLINLGERKNITDDDIEKYVGISKEYNVFELQNAFAKKDLSKAILIIQYFESNPKAYPIHYVLVFLYGYFSKCFIAFSFIGRNDSIESNNGVFQQHINSAKQYGYEGIERALLLLHEYNLKSVGINDTGTGGGSLMKELAFKIIS